MDMKLISPTSHMLASHPQIISTIHSKTIPEDLIYVTFIMHKSY